MSMPQSEHFTLTQLVDGVYTALAADEGGAFGNTGIVDLGDKVLLFDSCVSPQAARDLYCAAETLTGHKPSHLILSHAHIDHYQGACGLPASINVLSTPETQVIIQHNAEREATHNRDEIARQLEAFITDLEVQGQTTNDDIKRYDARFQIGYIKALLAARDEITTRVPDSTFNNAQIFKGSNRSAIAITYGGGHSPSDVVLHLPDDNIIFMGDLISVQRHPFLGAGNITVWLHILEEIKSLNVEQFVPGHGVVGTTHDLDETRDYINSMTALVDQHIHSGGTAQTLSTVVVPEQFRDWYFASWNFNTNLNALFAQRAPKFL
jgi:cyclase